MRKEYAFYLTDEQIRSIGAVGVADVEVSFTTSGMVTGTVMDEYEITCYTFRKDGEVVRETRGLDTDGWVTDVRSADGVWTYEVDAN
jgi:hypothetical protein